MKKEELHELVTELQNICDSLSSNENQIKKLVRLVNCIKRLECYPRYNSRVNEILDAIQTYTWTSMKSIDPIIFETECLISEINESLEREPLFTTVKKGFEEVKSTIDESIPEEMKDACKETIGQVKAIGQKTQKTVKSKIRNWLLSDDDE